jgi:hypothetical protein
MANRQDLQACFEQFHTGKPWIYERMCEVCQTLIDRGVLHASSTMVLEAVKLQQLLRTGEHIHLPNNFRAYYAKLWLGEHKTPWRFLRMTTRYVEGAQAASKPVRRPRTKPGGDPRLYVGKPALGLPKPLTELMAEGERRKQELMLDTLEGRDDEP